MHACIHMYNQCCMFMVKGQHKPSPIRLKEKRVPSIKDARHMLCVSDNCIVLLLMRNYTYMYIVHVYTCGVHVYMQLYVPTSRVRVHKEEKRV